MFNVIGDAGKSNVISAFICVMKKKKKKEKYHSLTKQADNT